MDRRDFFKHTAVTGASTFLMGSAPVAATARPAAAAANEKVRFACIGVGGKGDSDTHSAGSHGEVVALCDVDEKVLDRMAKDYPKAKKYFDYRTMLEEMGDKIDAVTVSTPDHTHAPASVMAMKMGKHCFCQKPLTWSVEEARVMRALAAEKKLCTQMGNQGTSHDGFREGVELIRSGALGPIKDVMVWTNRPIWPQGMSRPKETPGIPNNVRWQEFLGAAHDRPYNPAYAPFKWRGWLDFGTGALGDMACHTINVAAMGLGLFDPESIEIVDTSGIVDHESYPLWTIIRTKFGPTSERGPVTLTWFDGGEKLPESKRSYAKALEGYLESKKKEAKDAKDGKEPKVPGSGLLLIGEKGTFFSENDYGAEHELFPKENFKDFKKPKPTLPRSPGHFTEFVEAIKSNQPSKALSNFDYAGRLTETVLLGVVALKAGSTIEWDAAGMKAKNNSTADQYIRRDYRKGFSIH